MGKGAVKRLITNRRSGLRLRVSFLGVSKLCDVMQQNQPDNPATLEYATPQSPRPIWVRLGLWSVSSRASAWVFFWICIAIAVFSVIRGFSEPRWFWGVVMVLAALWYWASIRWVDRYSSWG
jgi:hypothetical protein